MTFGLPSGRHGGGVARLEVIRVLVEEQRRLWGALAILWELHDRAARSTLSETKVKGK